MADLKLNERMMRVINPLPKMTEAALMAKTKEVTPSKRPVRARPNAEKRQAFDIEFHYSAGTEGEVLKLPPGTQATIQASVARAIENECGQRGLVIVPENANPLQVARRKIRGLERAKEFFGENGLLRLSGIARSKQWSDDDRKMLEPRHAAYYTNEAKARACDVALKALEKGLPKLEDKYGDEPDEPEVREASAVFGNVIDDPEAKPPPEPKKGPAAATA